MATPFKKLRGINDRSLSAVLNNNAALVGMLLGWARATSRLNRFVLAWMMVATAAIIWLAVR